MTRCRPPVPRDLRRLLLVAALLLSASVAAAPAPYRMTYRLASDDTTIGELVQTLQRTAAGRWRFRSELNPSGFLVSLVSGRIVEVTELEEHAGRLRPLSYRFERRGLGRNRDVTVEFDWVARRAHNEVNGKRWSMEIPDNAIDKHSLLVRVAVDLAAGRLAAAYPVADGGRLKSYGHARLDDETVTTPLGELRALVIDRTRISRKEKQGTRFWHAPALDHLPVHVERVDDDGRVLVLTLTSYTRDPAPPAVPPAVPPAAEPAR